MSDITRRQALTHLAGAFVAAGAIDRLDAQAVHQLVQRSGAVATAPYTPKALSALQFRTLETLTDLIIPVENGKPGAREAGVAAWIDTLLNVNAELKSRYVTGLTWLDATMQTRHGRDFLGSTPAERAALLDTIAFQKNRSAELNPGIDFFVLARRMTVDGFYTSPVGMGEIYFGNLAKNEYVMPKEAVDYVISRSPFK
jgi:gluconate 2-dehydrogenase gamma chain